MRRLLPLFLILMSMSSAEATRLCHRVVELPEETIASIYNYGEDRKGITIAHHRGGSQALQIGPKTWIFKQCEDATFEDLKVGQRVRVHENGAQAVAIEILRSK